jgi:hypothetical protein
MDENPNDQVNHKINKECSTSLCTFYLFGRKLQEKVIYFMSLILRQYRLSAADSFYVRVSVSSNAMIYFPKMQRKLIFVLS